MSWLTGDWSSLHRVMDRGDGLWSRWCEDGTGLYRLVALAASAGIEPAPLQRVCASDPSGTLYIGSTSSLHRRVSQLVRSRDSERFTAKNYKPLPPRLAEAFPDDRLAVCWINLPETTDRFADERRLLAAYTDTFGEPPPLNAMTVDEAEIHDGAGWRRIGIAEALHEPRGAEMRCPSCGGRVRAHREGTTAQRAHFEHYQRNDGCPTKRGHKGPVTRHPRALN